MRRAATPASALVVAVLVSSCGSSSGVGHTEPATSEPATSEPATSEPATSEPPSATSGIAERHSSGSICPDGSRVSSPGDLASTVESIGNLSTLADAVVVARVLAERKGPIMDPTLGDDDDRMFIRHLDIEILDTLIGETSNDAWTIESYNGIIEFADGSPDEVLSLPGCFRMDVGDEVVIALRGDGLKPSTSWPTTDTAAFILEEGILGEATNDQNDDRRFVRTGRVDPVAAQVESMTVGELRAELQSATPADGFDTQ